MAKLFWQALWMRKQTNYHPSGHFAAKRLEGAWFPWHGPGAAGKSGAKAFLRKPGSSQGLEAEPRSQSHWWKGTASL